MFCKECGKPIDDDSKFCRYCGKEVIHAPRVEPAIQPEKEERGEDMEELLKDSRLIGYTFKNWWLIHLAGITAIASWTILFVVKIVSLTYPPLRQSDQVFSINDITTLVVYLVIAGGIYGYCLPALRKLYQIRKAGFYDEGTIIGNGLVWGIVFTVGALILALGTVFFSLAGIDALLLGTMLGIILIPFASSIYFSFISNRLLNAPDHYLLERREIEL